uniref:hypothetical protein n=1 Tax=Hymenobacter metallilatus TaxID=2493666 RepID=UPI0011CF9DAA|nr:hypothetical protein [Hymenobacter metallilatus]
MAQVKANPSTCAQLVATKPYLQPAAPRKAAQYAQMEKLLERVSQRAIVRLTGVARMTVAKLAKKSADRSDQ